MKISLQKTAYLFLFAMLFFFCTRMVVFSQSVSSSTDATSSQIQSITAQQQQLQQEIDAYQSQITSLGSQANSLANTIKTLDATINKNTLDIKLTQNRIQGTELNIANLSTQIGQSTDVINQDSQAVTNLLNELHQADDTSLIEDLLTYNSISDFWDQLNQVATIQTSLREKVSDTKDAKQVFENNKTAAQQKHDQLVALQSSLQDQKNILQGSKNDKTALLAQTKDKESNYQTILAQKKALSQSLNQELATFQSQLHLTISRTSYPAPFNGILSWPLQIPIIVTQPFGITAFSQTTTAYNALLGHNGVDLRAAIGTPVYAALDGVVNGTGNTDLVCPGASFGKWIFINHPDGLSTIYAHLSLIKVSAGNHVTAGQLIGYTGLTGYTTGPHLHFGLYVTQGSEITSYKSKVCAGTYTMPVGTLQAYLDPMTYLPVMQ